MGIDTIGVISDIMGVGSDIIGFLSDITGNFAMVTSELSSSPGQSLDTSKFSDTAWIRACKLLPYSVAISGEADITRRHKIILKIYKRREGDLVTACVMLQVRLMTLLIHSD